MIIEWKKLYYLITLFSYTVTIFLGISYIYNDSIVTLLLTLVMLIVSSTLYCFNNIKYYIIHLIFYITIFLFLVSRPTIDYFKYGLINTYQEDVYRFSFLAVITSIIGLTIGGLLVSKRENKLKEEIKTIKNKRFIDSLRKVSLSVFLISYPFYLVRIIERLVYRLNVSYYEYYADFKSELPYFTYILSTFAVYAMCIYLATKPNNSVRPFCYCKCIQSFNRNKKSICTKFDFFICLFFCEKSDRKRRLDRCKRKIYALYWDTYHDACYGILELCP